MNVKQVDHRTHEAYGDGICRRCFYFRMGMRGVPVVHHAAGRNAGGNLAVVSPVRFGRRTRPEPDDNEMSNKKLGDFSVGDLVVLRDRLSVAEQKDRYLDRIATESFFLPGLGQFEVGDTASGLD